uniref:Uncharacterized protein n=1 Tax=Zea mays TaxID=4577 RepID=B4FFX8_MAIZE|nr:unknown [Zea mays]
MIGRRKPTAGSNHRRTKKKEWCASFCAGSKQSKPSECRSNTSG